MNWRKPILLFLLKASGQKSYEYFNEIQFSQNLTQIEKKKLQNKKLSHLLIYSYQNIPYYKEVLDKYGVVNESLEINLENFSKIPVLTKDIIRERFDDLQDTSSHNRKVFTNTSGGSTGEPVKFIQDNVMWDWKVATKFYFASFMKKEVGEKELRLWGSERDLLIGNDSIVKKLKDYLYNRVECNSFKMSESEMSAIVKKINTFQPKTIESYAQSIYELAKYIQRNSLEVYSPQGGILTSAGTLYPEMATTISQVFECKVINRYGSREVGDVACSKNGSDELSINFLQNFIEIIDNNNNQVGVNESGKILVTTLNNFSMPLIRYDIGDIGIQSEKEFEIKSIEGREMSVFKTKSGKIIPGEFFIHFIGVVYNNGGISKIQAIQEDYEKIIIKTIIKDIDIFNKDKVKIVESIKKVMGEKCEVIFEIVDDIPNLPSGKFLYTVSKIK